MWKLPASAGWVSRASVPAYARVGIALCAVALLLWVVVGACTTLLPSFHSALGAVREEPARSALAAACCVLGCAAFVSLRGLLLKRAAGLWKVEVGFTRALRTFLEGVCVEVVSWPGKLWADAYRQRRLTSEHDLRARVLALATFRGATIAGSIATLAIGGAWASGRWSILLLGPVCLAARAVFRRDRVVFSGLGVGSSSKLALLASAGTWVDAIAFSCCAWVFAGVDPWAMVPMFVLAGFAAGVSTVPMGVGVLDAGLFIALTRGLGVDSSRAVGVIAVYRAMGPGLTIVLGAGSLLHAWVLGRAADCPIRTDGPLGDSHDASTRVGERPVPNLPTTTVRVASEAQAGKRAA